MNKDDFKKIIDLLVTDMENAYVNETELKMDGKTLHSDIGYAMEGWQFFATVLKDRIDIYGGEENVRVQK